jgi:hypothetical protein
MILHDNINKVIHRSILISNKNFAVQHLVVAQDIVYQLLVEVLRWGLEVDLHAAGFLLLEIDVGWRSVEADADSFEFGFEEGALFGTLYMESAGNMVVSAR